MIRKFRIIPLISNFVHFSAYDFVEEGIVLRSPEKEIIHILITQVYNQGLISKTTCQNSEDLLDSVIDIPQFLWYPVCLTKEGNHHGYTENSR